MESEAKKISERVVFNDANDIAWIDGIAVSGAFLRMFTQTTREGVWFRVQRKEDRVEVHQREDFSTPSHA